MKHQKASIVAVLAIVFTVFASSADARSANPLKRFKGDAFYSVAKSGSKIVAVGSAQSCRWSQGDCKDYYAPRMPLVARFTKSGKLDKSFNGTGLRLLDEKMRRLAINGIVVRPDRSLLIAYTSVFSYRQSPVRLVSLTPKGKLDRSFGVGGRAVTPSGRFSAGFGGSLLPLGNGATAIAGRALTSQPVADLFGILAIDANGDVDSDFGDNGIATIGPPSDPLEGYTGALAVQRSRGILALGSTDDSEWTHTLTAARFKFDGSLDPTFGTGGVTRFTPLDNNIIGLAAGAIIPFGDEGIAAACDIGGLRSMGPDGESSGSLFESGADERLLGCIDLADAARIGDGIVAVGATYDDYGDGLPHPWMWHYERTESGKLGPAQSRRALPRPFLGFNNAVADYRDGFVVAGSALSDRCRPPWRPGGTRCQVATLTRLTDHGRARSFGHNGVATLGGGRVCRGNGPCR